MRPSAEPAKLTWRACGGSRATARRCAPAWPRGWAATTTRWSCRPPWAARACNWRGGRARRRGAGGTAGCPGIALSGRRLRRSGARRAAAPADRRRRARGVPAHRRSARAGRAAGLGRRRCGAGQPGRAADRAHRGRAQAHGVHMQGVDEAAIDAAIAGGQDWNGLQAGLGCGTGCGSRAPEIRARIARAGAGGVTGRMPLPLDRTVTFGHMPSAPPGVVSIQFPLAGGTYFPDYWSDEWYCEIGQAWR